MPNFSDSWVTRIGHRAFAKVGRNENMIDIDPRYAPLRLRKIKPVGHKRPCLEVELASHICVSTTARKSDQSPLIIRPQQGRPLPNPILALRLGQRIEIEDDFPLGLSLLVLFERRSTPQSTLVVLVSPKVVIKLTPLRYKRYTSIRIEDVQEVRLKFLKTRLRLHPLDRDRISCLDPLERFIPRDILKPQIGVLSGFGILARDRRVLSHGGIRRDGRVKKCR